MSTDHLTMSPSLGRPPNHWADKLGRTALYGGLATMTAASMLMNASFGATLSASVWSSTILVAVFIASDSIKPFSVFWVANAFKHGRLTYVILSVVLMAMLVGWSLIAAYSFAVSERMSWQIQGAADRERATYVRGQLGDTNNDLRAHGAIRSSGEIEAERNAILSRALRSRRGTLGDYTQNCERPTPRTRGDCDRYHALGKDLARAREAERLRQRREQMETRALADWQNATPKDTQALSLAKLTGWQPETIVQIMAWFLAFLCELGSWLGLFLSRRLFSNDHDDDNQGNQGATGGSLAVARPEVAGPGGGDMVCPYAGRITNDAAAAQDPGGKAKSPRPKTYTLGE